MTDFSNYFPGGFVEAVGSTPRAKWVAGDYAAFVPASRGMFTFPAPYNTRAWRITQPSDTGGLDGVWYNGYSYWPKMNAHIGQESMKILVGLNTSAGGDGPNLWSLNKTTDELTKLGWLFNAGSPWRNLTPEMWYFSLSDPNMLYLTDWHKQASQGDLQRMNLSTGTITNVFDISAKHGNVNAIARQCHSSADDKHHVGTVFLSTFTQVNTLGAFYYNEETDTYRFYSKVQQFDEAHIDKSGRYTYVSETSFGDRVTYVYDNTTGALIWTVPKNPNALAHLDTGYGYAVGGTSFQTQAGSVKILFPASLTVSPTIHYSFDFTINVMNYPSHTCAADGYTMDQQMLVGSNADTSAWQNEITCCRLNTSLAQLIVAPTMADVSSGGGADAYARNPKGVLDVTGQYFLWTANTYTSRMDAYLVKVPRHLLGLSFDHSATIDVGGFPNLSLTTTQTEQLNPCAHKSQRWRTSRDS